MAKAYSHLHRGDNRVTVLCQAFTLWLLDMHSLPLMYTQSQGFKQVYREYYLRFTNDIQHAMVASHSMRGRRGNDNGKVTPYPTSSGMSEDEGEGITLLDSITLEYAHD